MSGSIARVGTGGWEVRYRDDAGASRRKRFRLKDDAVAFLAETTTEVRQGDYISPEKRRTTFAEVAEDWLATLVKRPKTLAGYESLLRVHLLPTFGAMPVGSIKASDVRKFLAGKVRGGTAAGTVRNAYRVLKPVLDFAVEDGCLRANPCNSVRIKDIPEMRIKRREMLCLDAEQVARLAAAADGLWPEQHYGVLVTFAAYTGMRSGEVTALRMANLDLLRGVARVRESVSEVGGELHSVPPKTYEDRDVSLPPTLVAMLRDYVAGQPAKGPSDYVFTMPDGTQVRHNAWFYRAVFQRAVRDAGLNPGLRFHDLRHTCAALMIALNLPILAVKDRLGHSTIQVTMDRYGHLLPSVTDAVVTGLDALMQQPVRRSAL
jgi:integrase